MRIIRTEGNNIYIGNDALPELNTILMKGEYSSIFMLVDQNTKKHCLPKVRREKKELKRAHIISIISGEKNKNIHSCEKIWKALTKQNADRNSLLINIGGGVITDIGGFAASAYKRGIDYINIPTTLLAQVDASVGGKTGIDFLGFKNQIGSFSLPKAVFILPAFLITLSKRELLSGFAELIKHGLIADKSYWNLLRETNPFKTNNWEQIIFDSVKIKNEITTKDPHEKGIRKALNFGHTVGHAIESALMNSKKPILHGEAIAMGMICETFLSHKYCILPDDKLQEITTSIISWFGHQPIKYPAKRLIQLMKQDKKNNNSEINFSLISSIGKAEINNYCTEDLIEESLLFLNTRGK